MLKDIPKEKLLEIVGSLREENGDLRRERTEFAAQNSLLASKYEIEKMRADYAILALNARTDDALFCGTFGFFEHYAQPGQFYGVVHICNREAHLQIVGRWGKPKPESLEFCEAISEPFINRIIQKPCVSTYEIGKDPRVDEFSRGLPAFVGTSVMTVPLMPHDGELIGALFIYKKGEQLFSARERRIAEIFVQPAGLATMRIG